MKIRFCTKKSVMTRTKAVRFFLFFTVFLVAGLLHMAKLRCGRVTSFTMLDTSYLLRSPDTDPTEAEIFDNIIQQDNPRLLAYIRRHHVLPPPSHPLDSDSSRRNYGNPSRLREQLNGIFGRKVGGIFVEAGANDGVFLSNTLELERDRHWVGLLVEPNMFLYTNLRHVRRNAWISNACMSFSPIPSKTNMTHIAGREIGVRGIGHVSDGETKCKGNWSASGWRAISAGRTSCFPLYSLLLSVGMPQVDYLSLDVQGIEFKVLQSVPWDKVRINVITAEHNCIPEGKEAMRKFLMQKGYYVHNETIDDFTFVHERIRSCASDNFGCC